MDNNEYVLRQYGNSIKKLDRFILVVGREPNNASTQVLQPSIGEYPIGVLKNKGRNIFWCCFWGVAQRVAVMVSDIAKEKDYKQISMDVSEIKECNPLLLTNALPVSIPSEKNNKNMTRKNYQDKDIDNHFQNLNKINEKIIFERIEVIWFVGLDNDMFKESKERFRYLCCKSKGEIDFPFFSNRNMKKIRDKMNPPRAKARSFHPLA